MFIHNGHLKFHKGAIHITLAKVNPPNIKLAITINSNFFNMEYFIYVIIKAYDKTKPQLLIYQISLVIVSWNRIDITCKCVIDIKLKTCNNTLIVWNVF